MGPTSPLTVDGAAIGRATGDGPGPSSRPAAGSSSPAGARPSSARCPGPEGAPTLLLLHGWVRDRRAELVPGVRARSASASG